MVYKNYFIVIALLFGYSCKPKKSIGWLCKNEVYDINIRYDKFFSKAKQLDSVYIFFEESFNGDTLTFFRETYNLTEVEILYSNPSNGLAREFIVPYSENKRRVEFQINNGPPIILELDSDYSFISVNYVRDSLVSVYFYSKPPRYE